MKVSKLPFIEFSLVIEFTFLVLGSEKIPLDKGFFHVPRVWLEGKT